MGKEFSKKEERKECIILLVQEMSLGDSEYFFE